MHRTGQKPETSELQTFPVGKKYTAPKTTKASLKRKDTCLPRRRLLRIPFSLFSYFSRSLSPNPFPPTNSLNPPFSHVLPATSSPNVFFFLSLPFLSSFLLLTLTFQDLSHLDFVNICYVEFVFQRPTEISREYVVLAVIVDKLLVHCQLSLRNTLSTPQRERTKVLRGTLTVAARDSSRTCMLEGGRYTRWSITHPHGTRFPAKLCMPLMTCLFHR